MFLKKISITAILLVLTFSVVRHGRLWRIIDAQTYAYSRSEERQLGNFANARYDYGIKAWNENNPAAAEQYFNDAISADTLHIDAWLNLAELYDEKGEAGRAEQILEFVDRITGPVVKWKWRIILLARQLGREDIFLGNINFVIPISNLGDDALQLLDLHYAADTEKTMSALTPENLAHYLQWLMKWSRTRESMQAWTEISNTGLVDDRLKERYVNYLIWRKEIKTAAAIWKPHAGIDGMTNPGFEQQITERAFDWRSTAGDHWKIRRIDSESASGGFALETAFSGKKNVNFHHLHQIVPVEPGKTHQLTFWWRSRNISTDQRPFMEVVDFDCGGVLAKSEMIPPDTDWRRESISFNAPDDCNAVLVRLRRYESHRFDCQIDGKLWLDDFSLSRIEIQNQIRN